MHPTPWHGDGPASDDEFRFLASDAARVGRASPLPAVARVRLGETAELSALAYAPPAEPEVLALHGAGLNAHSFDPMLLALARPALSIDLPGHGRSEWRADADYRPATIAPTLAAALAPLAARPRDVVGHSLGGLVAALVADRLPALVGRLFLVDISPGVLASKEAAPEDAPAATSRIQEFITGRRDYGSVEEIVERAIEFGIGSDPVSLTRGVSLNTRRRSDGRLEWTHHLAHLDSLVGSGQERPRTSSSATDPEDSANGPVSEAETVWAALSRVRVPVTLIRASRGLVDSGLADEWRDRLPGSRVVTLDGPHNLHEAAPAELAAALR